MALEITPQLISLIQDAALKSFWRKNALRQFLRTCRIQESFISTWADDETKRDFLYRLFDALQKSRSGDDGLRRMATFLSVQTVFPDLEGWEDSTKKKKDASIAVETLRAYLASEVVKEVSEREQIESRERVAAIRQERTRQQQDLSKLNERLTELSTRIGTTAAGYDFQPWFYDLMDFFEIDSRRPYVTDGRQIDGSVTLDGTTYLVELKFTAGQADATDIDTFFKKVSKKADNTMGLMVSISGYSSVAIDEASCDKTPLLLLDYNHVYAMLSGSFSFIDIVRRVRRHASQTGQAFLSMGDFGG
jgi:hypothetical protein